MSKRAVRLTQAAVAVSLCMTTGACGGSSPSSPSSQAARMTASLSPSPMMTRAQDGGAAGARYQIAGELTFQAAAGFSGRITSIDLTILCTGGEGGHGTVSLDLPVAAGAPAAYQLTNMIQMTTPQDPQRLRVIAKGVDGSGAAFTVPTLEIELIADSRVNTGPDVTVLAAGDIAVCGAASTEATAQLLSHLPGIVTALGDNVYPTGSAASYANCYAPTWGRYLNRTRPTPGNHEYDVPDAAPYYAYFGADAGPAGLGYYSFTIGAWHAVSLNSNIASDPGSPQYQWLKNDLDASNAPCTLAYWHHPLFSSGGNGNIDRMREIWRLLDAHRAEIVLVGHDHDYERFAPQDADGNATVNGVREFVVGTGGAPLRPVGAVKANSLVRENSTWGVLKLVLRPAAYSWDFVPIDGQAFTDAGMSACTP